MSTLLRHLTCGNAFFFIIILGIGGTFQNGFHASSISSPSPHIQRFINSSWFDRYDEVPRPETVTLIWSAIVSVYAVGGLCGALTVRFVTGLMGRKQAMFVTSFISIVSSVVMLTSKSAKSFGMIMIARFLYGTAAALGCSIHLMYLGESSPTKIRGMVTLTGATFISIGKLSGQVFGLSEILGREEFWNILLCVPTCFSVVSSLMLPFFPEAPRYTLIEKGDAEACQKALQVLWGHGEYKQEMEEMKAEQAVICGVRSKTLLELMRDRSNRWQLITILVFGTCIQLCGISVITIFSYDIMLRAGIPNEKIRYVTLGIGASEVLTSIFCVSELMELAMGLLLCYILRARSGRISAGSTWAFRQFLQNMQNIRECRKRSLQILLIERVGRRPLLWGGFGAMSVIQVLITVMLKMTDSSIWFTYSAACLIFIFVIFYGGGPAAASVAVPMEIFIQSCRPAAFVFYGILQWLGMAVQGLTFPFFINALDSYCFLLFAFVCLVAFLYFLILLPETRGKPLLQISQEFKDVIVCRWRTVDKFMETKF